MDLLGVVRGVLVAAALAAPILAGANTPDGFWTNHHEILFVSVIAGVVAAGWDPIIRELGQSGRRRRTKCEYYSRLAVAALLVSLVEMTGTDWRDTGVYVYQVRRGRVPLLRQLTRICELRLRRISSDMSDVRWSFGRGVVGKCWAEQENVVIDWSEVSQNLAAEIEHIGANSSIAAEKAWRKISKENRWGLTYRQYRDSQAYKRIASYPVKNPQGRMIGVLSIDGPIDKARLEAVDVLQVVNAAAATVAGHL
jgi:hypothetical protein